MTGRWLKYDRIMNKMGKTFLLKVWIEYVKDVHKPRKPLSIMVRYQKLGTIRNLINRVVRTCYKPFGLFPHFHNLDNR